MGIDCMGMRENGNVKSYSWSSPIGSYSVKRVADRYRHAAYHNKHW